MADPIKDGDVIRVRYTGRDQNGEVFDTTDGRGPFTYVVGSGAVMRGFDAAVLGSRAGERTRVILAPDQAYGARNEECVISIPRSSVPAPPEYCAWHAVETASAGGQGDDGYRHQNYQGTHPPRRQPPPGGKNPDVRYRNRGYRPQADGTVRIVACFTRPLLSGNARGGHFAMGDTMLPHAVGAFLDHQTKETRKNGGNHPDWRYHQC